jgi:2-polyprenyl-6-methoxyphenol hydroxylase-like FAD-dependent oxidoreductase
VARIERFGAEVIAKMRLSPHRGERMPGASCGWRLSEADRRGSISRRSGRAGTNDEVRLFEQNAADATWGFGVVFSDQALEFLRDDDPDTVDAIAPHMQAWRDITIVHRGQPVAIDGVGFSAIGRLQLLQLLQRRAGDAGVVLQFGHAVQSMAELAGYDLVVAADGVNSFVRRAFEGDFGFQLSYSQNKFAWYGTPKRFDTLTQTFVANALGTFNAHHYRYAPDMSTFIVECDPATWVRAGFDEADEAESRRVCEQVFAAVLDGRPLVSNRSIWRSFPWVWNERWSTRNHVLIGDALHTAHYSIGSGTRLAIEDAVALAKALEAEPGNVPAGLARYEAARRPIVEKLVATSKMSAAWYDRFAEPMRLEPLELAMSYITRSGRIDADRLRAMSPGFMALYDAQQGRRRT